MKFLKLNFLILLNIWTTAIAKSEFNPSKDPIKKINYGVNCLSKELEQFP